MAVAPWTCPAPTSSAPMCIGGGRRRPPVSDSRAPLDLSDLGDVLLPTLFDLSYPGNAALWLTRPDCLVTIPAASATGFTGTFSPYDLHSTGIIDAQSWVALTWETIGLAGPAGILCSGTCRSITGPVQYPEGKNWVGSWIMAFNGMHHAVGAEKSANSDLTGTLVYPVLWTSPGSRQKLTDDGVATAINASDQIVLTDSVHRSYLWQAGTTTDLGSLGGSGTLALGINDAGQVVGVSTKTNGAHHAFLWQSGTMTDLGTLGGASSSAEAINNAGQVVGTSLTSSGATHAFLWQGGTMIDLGTLGGTMSALSRRPGDLSSPSPYPVTLPLDDHDYGPASGPWLPNKRVINDAGQVVGRSTTAAGETHAFVWQAGTMRDLGTAGKTSAAVAINASGQIAMDEGGVVLFDPAVCP